MEEIAMVIEKYGLTAVLTAYFLFKDWKTTGKMLDVLAEVKNVLTKICIVIGVTENETQSNG